MSVSDFEQKIEAAVKSAGGEVIANLPSEESVLTGTTKKIIGKFDIRIYKFPNIQSYRKFYEDQNVLVLESVNAPKPESVSENNDGSVTIPLKIPKMIEPKDLVNTSSSLARIILQKKDQILDLLNEQKKSE